MAMSITPGETEWSQRKQIHDVLKSLKSCGSFLVVEEEYSTVQFAHSSIKRHLLSHPTDEDVGDYHVNPLQADSRLLDTIITYLNFRIFDTQVATASRPTRSNATNIPGFVMKSSLPKRITANKMALALLKARKTTGQDLNLTLEGNALHGNAKDRDVQDLRCFLPYCQDYWLHHSRDMDSANDPIYRLWVRLVEGKLGTVELPWAPEQYWNLEKRFVAWLVDNRHKALIATALNALWRRHFSLAFDHAQLIGDLSLFETLLNLVPSHFRVDKGIRPLVFYCAPGVRAWTPVQLSIEEAAMHDYHAVFGLLLREAAEMDVGYARRRNHNLQLAVCSGHADIARLLIENGADVNFEGGKYGSPLQAAAATAGMQSIVELLIATGARINTPTVEYWPALIHAVGIGEIKTVESLLEAGADVEAQKSPWNYTSGNIHSTALTAAVARGDETIVRLLIAAGAKVKIPDRMGNTPLRIAAHHGYTAVVMLLLNEGARVEFGWDIPEYRRNIEQMGSLKKYSIDNYGVPVS